jgi:hypothetical protein
MISKQCSRFFILAEADKPAHYFLQLLSLHLTEIGFKQSLNYNPHLQVEHTF